MSFVIPKNRSLRGRQPAHKSDMATAVPVPDPGRKPPSWRRSRPASKADSLAHDARNWLTVLRVYCDLLRTSGGASADQGRWLEELSRAVERGHGLVSSLIDTVHRQSPEALFAPQPQAGKSGEEPRNPAGPPFEFREHPSLDLNDAVRRREPLLRHLAGDRIQVAIDVPEGPQHVRIAEISLERILLNLVRNAIEAMPDGGQLGIALRPGAAGRTGGPRSSEKKAVRLIVSDTGDGIPAGKLARIFEAGRSLRAPEDPMRGLGLAIVSELAERAGGTVHVRSEPGKGARFAIEFPADEPIDESAAEKHPPGYGHAAGKHA